MAISAHSTTHTIALIGNPNTGKSTLFNALSGIHQRVGNYPGVTVEKKIGKAEIEGRSFHIVDLPGTYSLAPRSPDEMVAVDVLLGRRTETSAPDVILCIVDASNLERNLYLVSQVLELGRPIVVALNMGDIARQRGIQIDVDQLEKRLGAPVVEIQAHRKLGLDRLRRELVRANDRPPPRIPSPFPSHFQAEVAELQAVIDRATGQPWPRFLAERLLLDTGGYIEQIDGLAENSEVRQQLSAARKRLEAAGSPVPAVEAISRYQWVGELLDGVLRHPDERPTTFGDRIDRLLTHKLWGTLVFLMIMVLMFQSIFTWAQPVMEGLQGLVEWGGQRITGFFPEGAIRSMLIDGVVAGVGGVVVFLPQIFVLFFFIAVLEDCGYMARAAYLMDKLMARVGLSGKSFIPLLSSFACAIPGIMAARVIENRRDRLVTILVAPLMSCSARIPVYTLLIAAFIPQRVFFGGWLGLQGLTLFAMYLLGIVTAVIVAWILKKSLLRGETPPFVMELPSYKLPSPRNVLTRMLERGWAFIRRAGTLILAVSVVVWAAAYFPHSAEIGQQVRDKYAGQLDSLDQQLARLRVDRAAAAEIELVEQQRQSLMVEINRDESGTYMRQSILGRMGRTFEPLVRPLGWDWRIGSAVVASFPAREVVIGAMGVIYNLGDEQDEASEPLQRRLREVTWEGTDRPVFNIPVALSIMVFFSLCAQCSATLVIMRRETNRWSWPIFTFVYMTALAYMAALVVYQVGIRVT